MLMANSDHITFIPQFDAGRETMQKWAQPSSATQTEWFHVASIVLHTLDQDAQVELVRAYATARREHPRDLVYAVNAIKRVFQQRYQAKDETKPPHSVLADTADSVLAKKNRTGRAAG